MTRAGPTTVRYLAELCEWYEKNRRDLPWRRKPNPYDTWISEIMSQQSTLKTVIPYFLKWKEKFPNLESLIEAEESEVLATWAGLGYYSRARNIKKAAPLIQDYVQRHRDWPQSPEEWMGFPGIGPYTARAICSIALGQKTLPIDGNVIRVVSRFALIPDPLNKAADLRRIHEWVDETLPQVPDSLAPASLAQGFMELGATICRPGDQALCPLCPLRKGCQAFALREVALLPRAKQRPQPEEKIQLALLYKDPKKRWLMREIPAGERLQGHHELPLWTLDKTPENIEIINNIRKHFEIRGPVRHSITRYRFESFLVMAGDWGKEEVPEAHSFWEPESKQKLLPTTLTRKLFKLLETTAQ